MSIAYYDSKLGEAGLIEGGVWRARILERDEDKRGLFYRVRILRRVEALKAFVVTGVDKEEWLLRDSDCAEEHKPGDVLCVQYENAGYGKKLPVVTERVSLSNELLVLQHGLCGVKASRKLGPDVAEKLITDVMPLAPTDSWGLKLRTAAGEASAEELEDAARELVKRHDEILRLLNFDPVPALLFGTSAWEAKLFSLDADAFATDSAELARRAKGRFPVVEHDPTFSCELDSRIAPERRYWLDRVIENDDCQIVVDSTEACHVIDVNSRARTLSLPSKQQRLRTNLACIPLVCGAIRLKPLSGIVLVDLLRMDEKGRAELDRALRDALREEDIPARCLGFSRAGLYEILVSRTRE